MRTLTPHSPLLATILLYILVLSCLPVGLMAGPPGEDDGSSLPLYENWTVSPVAGLVFGGIYEDAPGTGDIVYGVRVGHTIRPALRTVYSAAAHGGAGDFVFMNARVDYLFRPNAFLEPFATAGAGLITGDTGTEFDFLFGLGLELSLADRLSVEEAAIMHLSPAQALTDREGNPFTVLESSVSFRF